MARIGFAQMGFYGDNRDFFPAYREDPPYVPYGPTLSFDALFELIWRARKLHYDIVIDGTDYSYEVDMHSWFDAAGGVIVGPPANERHIRCYIEGETPTESGSNPFTQYSWKSAPLALDITEIFIGNYYSIYWNGPVLETFVVPWSFSFFDGANQISSGASGGDPVSGVTYSVLGLSQTLYDRFGPGTPTGHVNVTISEWWPYANADGPVWDSATGTQLIVPAPLGI